MISIITPSFNQARYIERTIQSVLSQNIHDLEYFVIDGGSQDETVTILKRYANHLTFVSEKDNGQADAVNKGLKRATGDIIGWLNSDDIYYPDTIQKIKQYFENNPDIDVVYGDAYHIDHNDKIINRYPTETWNISRLTKTCFISQPTVFWRRSVLEKWGYLNDALEYCLDYEYWLRLARQGARFGYIKEILAGSRLYPETKTCSSPLKAQREAIQMLKNQMGYVSHEWLITYAITLIKNNTSLRYPKLRFMFLTWGLALRQAFYWNGFGKGVKAFFFLPFIMLKMKSATS
ncbi:MAG: glycosyltransferase [Gammaproteobacteria bacterium]|nr:glycosyltransferase [Gammaproteobacteria bacterium]